MMVRRMGPPNCEYQPFRLVWSRAACVAPCVRSLAPILRSYNDSKCYRHLLDVNYAPIA